MTAAKDASLSTTSCGLLEAILFICALIAGTLLSYTLRNVQRLPSGPSSTTTRNRLSEDLTRTLLYHQFLNLRQ